MSGPFRLDMWVVYGNPKDFPDRFIARRWEGEMPTDNIIVSTDLDVVRDKLQGMGLVKIDRDPDDPPVILETWL